MRKFDELLLKTMDESSGHVYLYCCDMKTDLSQWSKNAAEDFGIPEGLVHDMNSVWLEHIHPDDRERYRMDLDRTFRGEQPRHCCQYRAKNRRGIYNWLQCEGTVSFDPEGNPEEFAGYIFNLGPKNKYDALTSLRTIHVFQECMEQVLEDPSAKGYLMVVGIDDFTRLNDLYTFSVGDRILQAFAQEIQEECSRQASLFRLDGDKFGVICEHADEEQVVQLYERFRRRGSSLRLPDFTQRVPVNISAGAVSYGGGSVTVDVLHRNASYAMEMAKENGKNRLMFFSDDMLQVSLRKLKLLKRLQDCVSADFEGFYPVFQPLVDAATGRIRGCEALLRWSDEELGSPGPVEFIPLLENSGLIEQVGIWILRQAFAWLARWQERSESFVMSVNVSYGQFKNPRFQSEVLKAAEEFGVRKDHVILELTESCKVEKMDTLRRELEGFREAGILTALDDFGTGYASISVLREVPADIVKIEHSFVRQIKDNAVDRAILKHLIKMCQSIGIRVCVEGIENREIYQIVAEYHPDYYQGYYYSVPVRAEEFEKLL